MKEKVKVVKPKGLYVEISDFGRDTHAVAVSEALRELSKKMKKAEIFQDLKKREHYVKPGLRKRLERNDNIRRSRADQKENNFFKK